VNSLDAAPKALIQIKEPPGPAAKKRFRTFDRIRTEVVLFQRRFDAEDGTEYLIQRGPGGRTEMLRINRLTDYGTLALTYMATHPGRLHSAADLASELGLGAPTVSKVLKMLGRRDLVRSIRGLRGGYSLGRAPE